MIKHLDLFSGIGGFTLAAQMVGGIKTTQFVEIDPFCQKVLEIRFPSVQIHDDIQTFNAAAGEFDLITGGFPCQDISAANSKGRGLEGDRSGLFFEIVRLVRQIRPRYLVLENTSALLTHRGGRDMGAVLWELSQIGLDAEWSVVSCCALGAPHTRERVFIVAYPDGKHGAGRMAVSRAHSQHLQQGHSHQGTSCWQGAIPSPPGVANGLPDRVDRLRSLGNSVSPQAAAVALGRVKALSERGAA
ncbi:MAG: DNA (cytosine-5-)-methyltransferase [Cyanobacteria bacterium P01_A01_bin.123]